jgi:hypothetical protein
VDEPFHHIDKSLAVLAERVERKFEALEGAIRLQASEYERRLELLNHEAAQLKSMQETYLQKSLYQSEYKEVLNKIASIQSWKDASSSRIITIAGIAGTICSIIISLLGYVFIK